MLNLVFCLIVMVIAIGTARCGRTDTHNNSYSQLVARSSAERKIPFVIGHRGDSNANPENTVPSFFSAIGAGADFIEFDYRHTKDDVPVAMHDSTLDRTTDAVKLWGQRDVKIKETLFNELRELDAGSWFAPEFSGTTVPHFKEAVLAISKGAIPLIERKTGDATTCVGMLHDMGLAENVVVQAFNWHFLENVHKLDPEIVIAALGSGKMTKEKMKRGKGFGASIMSWRGKYLTAESVKSAHRYGLKVWAFTINDPEDIRDLTDMGVDGIITDQPADTRVVLEDHLSVPGKTHSLASGWGMRRASGI